MFLEFISVLFVFMFLAGVFMLLSYHPFHIILLLVSYSFMLSYVIFGYMKSVWFSYVFILLFAGGLMVVFVYLTSLAPNEWGHPKVSFIIFVSSALFIVYLMNDYSGSQNSHLSGFYGFSFFVVIMSSLFLLVVFLFIIKLVFDPEHYMKSSL